MFGPSGAPGGGLALLFYSLILSALASIIYLLIKPGFSFAKIKALFLVFVLSFIWFLVTYVMAVFIFNLFSAVEFQYAKNKLLYGLYFMVCGYLSFYYILYYLGRTRWKRRGQ